MIKYIIPLLLVAVMFGGSAASDVYAYDREALRARLDVARAEREARSVARRAAREVARNKEEETELPPSDNSCDVDFDLDKASLVWTQSGLVFEPRADIKIDADDVPVGEGWNVQLNYEGTATYTEGTIALSPDSSFAGAKSWNGNGSSKFRFEGQSLPDVVIASGLTRSHLGEDDELEGVVRMKGVISGCDSSVFDEQFSFKVEEFGDRRVRSWRRVR